MTIFHCTDYEAAALFHLQHPDYEMVSPPNKHDPLCAHIFFVVDVTAVKGESCARTLDVASVKGGKDVPLP